MNESLQLAQYGLEKQSYENLSQGQHPQSYSFKVQNQHYMNNLGSTSYWFCPSNTLQQWNQGDACHDINTAGNKPVTFQNSSTLVK